MLCEKIAKMEALNCLVYSLHWFQRVTRIFLIHVQSVAGSVKQEIFERSRTVFQIYPGLSLKWFAFG